MMIDLKYRPELAVSKDQTRAVLQHVNLITKLYGMQELPGRGWMVATDGIIAAIMPVTLDAGDKLGMVRSDLCTLARRAKRMHGSDSLHIRIGSRYIRTDDGICYPRFADNRTSLQAKYPDLNVLLSGLRPDAVLTGSMHFNTKNLVRVMRALGGEYETLEFHGSGPVIVRLDDPIDGIGLISPACKYAR